MRRHFITALLLIAPYAGVAVAQDSTQTQKDSVPQDTTTMRQAYSERSAPQSDDAILTHLHRANLMEIKAGQVAQRNSRSAKVKSFAARLVRDHTAADRKVTALAKQLGFSLAAGPWMDSTGNKYGHDHDRMDRRDTTQDNQAQPNAAYGQDSTRQDGMRRHAQEMQRLSTLRGAEFDTAFVNAMAEGHEKAISMLEAAQPQVQHEELRTLITATLPTLRAHLQLAQSLGGTVTTTTSSR